MRRTKHGFTLVELIIVIAVIGVLAAILIPTFSNVIDKANAKSALSDARNTVTQYLTDSFDKGLPENLVVVVKKANNYYLYGYNTTGEGSIQVSSGNPYRGLADVTALMNTYSWNAKQDEMNPPDPNTEYTEAGTYGAFYLVPYVSGIPDPSVPIKGFHAGKADVDMAKYPNLKEKMTEDMGDNTDVFHGILLPGQFTLDTGANGSGTSTGNGGSGGSGGGSIPETPKYTVTASASPADSSTLTINGESVGEKMLTQDTEVTLICTPASGYTFKSWTVNGTENASTDPVYTIDKLQANITLVAVCEEEAQHDVWDGTTPDTQPEMAGSGTAADPYIITTPEQLAYLASRANASETAATSFHKGKHFKLGNDIYLNEHVLKDGKWELVDDTSSLHEWTPIGKSTTYSFKGFFDGNGYTIHGLYINGTSSYSGLFGYIVETGTTYANDTTNRIFNLTVDDAYVKGGNYTAGIIAHCQLKGVVSGLTYKGVVESSGITCGGVVAYTSSLFGNIENCKAYGTITCTNAGTASSSTSYGGVGGIVGYSYSSSYAIKNCQNYMTLTQSNSTPSDILCMAGICGRTSANSGIENCQNYGSVSTIKYAGGICGFAQTTSAISFTNCANLASVNGSTYVGGIVGMASSSKGNKFTACANFKDITGTSTYIGGICGNTGGASSTKAAFTNCYNTGNVHTSTTSNPYMAGIGVSSTTYVTFKNCYNTGSVTYGGSSSNYMGSIYVCKYSQMLSNCHALEGSCIKTSTSVTTHDASWFTSADAVSTLNSVAVADTVSTYVNDAKGINGGRPILAWQA